MSFLVSVFKPLAYLSLPVVLLRTIAANSPTGRYYVRAGLYVGALSAVAVYGVVLAAGMSLVGQRFNVNFVVARTFYAMAGKMFDIQVEIEGEEHLSTQPAILMANHQSMVDVLILGRLMPKRTTIMAKKSLQFSPLGPFMTMGGAIFVDRGNNARAVRSLAAAGESMKHHNLSLWIYPEGTRHSSEVPDMLPLKKGGFHLAVQAGIPIIPVVAENYWRIYRQGIFGSGTLKVRVLPPIPTTDLTATDIADLAIRVRDQMLVALREISIKVPSGQSEKSEDQPRISPQPIHTESPAVSLPGSIPSEGAPAPEIPEEEASRGSRESLSMSISSSDSANPSRSRRYQASETGTETEEDEGMVLVGRPL